VLIAITLSFVIQVEIGHPPPHRTPRLHTFLFLPPEGAGQAK
jgi:hypothetical protein